MHDIYRRMVESLPLCIYLAEFEPHGRWEYVSPQIETLTGYTADEWTSQPELWLKSIHPDDKERVLEEEERYRTLPRGTQWTHEYRLIRRDGDAVWVRDRALLVEVEDGRHLVEGFLTDIGEERLDPDGDPQPDVFRIACADCGRVWASVFAETGCGSCGSTDVGTESMDNKTSELAQARRETELLLTGIMGHLERLGNPGAEQNGHSTNGGSPTV